MLKELIPFLILGIVYSAASTSIAVAPVSNTLESPLATTDYFLFSLTPNGDAVTITADLINEKLTLGGKTLASCAADGSNWKCKPAEALDVGTHTLAVVQDAKISDVALAVTEATKDVLIPAISARPTSSTVKGEIAADTEIDITLTANAAPGEIAGSAFSSYFKLGTVNLGTCTGTGFASSAAAKATATIKCKIASKLAISSTAYTFALQDSKTEVSSKTIGAFGDVTVSSTSSNTNNSNNGKFLNLSCIFFFFTLLF